MKALVGFSLFAVGLSAQAQAQSSVTIYGLLDASISVINNGATNSKQLNSGVGPGSRLGFKGIEKLGGGLEAQFVLENGFAVDTGTVQQGGALFGRQAFVGLGSPSDGWSVTLGRHYTPSLFTFAATDVMGQVYWGNTAGGIGYGLFQAPGATAGTGAHGQSVRANNSINVIATQGNLIVRALVSAGEDSGGAGDLQTIGVTYTAGKALFSGSFARIRQNFQSIISGASPEWQNEVVLGGAYDFQILKLYAGYYGFNPSEANRTPAPTTAAGLAADPRFLRQRSYWLGARIPLGTGALLMQAMRTLQDYPAADGSAMTYALTYNYPLSKRTSLYASHAQVKNSDTGRVPLLGATVVVFPANAGVSLRGSSLGIIHTF